MKLFISRKVDLLRSVPSLLPLLFGLWFTCIYSLIHTSPAHAAPEPPTVSGFWYNSSGGFHFVFGSGFVPGTTSVSIGGVAAPIMQVFSNDMLAFSLPSPGLTGLIAVTTSSGTATSTAAFGPPSSNLAINGIWPSKKGCLSGSVLVFGSGFTADSTIMLNNVLNPIKQLLDSGLIFFLPPFTSVTGPITISNPPDAIHPSGQSVTTADIYASTPPAKPLPISLLRTTVDFAKGSGTATVAGQAGSVEPCSQVTIRNETKIASGQSAVPPWVVSEVTGAAGSFGPLNLQASAGDHLSFLVSNPVSNTSSTVTLGGKPVTTTLTVLEDPVDYGNYPVGTLEMDDEMAFPRFENLISYSSLAWARIMYPATTGTAWTPGKPVLNAAMANLESSNGSGFPVVVFIHANSQTCNYSDPANQFAPICYPNPTVTSVPEDRALRIPNHEGYNYLMERLASHGVFVISVNKIRTPMLTSAISQGQLVMEYLDMLREWNTLSIQNKTDPSDKEKRFPFVGLCDSNGPCSNPLNRSMFVGRLDLNRVGLSGHSMGGAAVVQAWSLNSKRPDPNQRFTISAINNIAPQTPVQDYPTVFEGVPFSVPFSLIFGSRDGDFSNVLDNFASYDASNPPPSSSPKMAQYVYGANHKFFNTIMTEDRDLACGTTGARPQPDCMCTPPTVVMNCIAVTDAIWTEQINPWVGARDDATTSGKSIADGGGRISAFQQRLAAVRALVPFFRWHLRDKPAYKEMLTGEHRFSGLENRRIYYTYQEGNRKVVDGFEDSQPSSGGNCLKYTNSLKGVICANGFDFFKELYASMLSGVEGLSNVFPTFVGVLGWSGPATYSTELPVAVAPVNHTDISSYRYLSFRVAESIKLADWTTAPLVPPAPRINLFLSLVDGLNIQSRELRTDQYGFIPQPFTSKVNKLTVLSGIRIPLEHFTLNGANINLSDIRKIVFRMEGSGYVAIDDIELSN